MKKSDELNDPQSCLNKAGDDDWIFVLIPEDEDAPDTIRDWIARRIRRGKNKAGDAKLVNAERCARAMEAQQHERELMP